MPNSTVQKITISVLIGGIFVICGYVIAIPISKYMQDSIQDVMFLEGLAVTVIGLMATIQGDPIGISLMGLGDKAGGIHENINLETTMKERSSTDYIKNFTKQAIVDFTPNRLTVVLGGILTMLFAWFVL